MISVLHILCAQVKSVIEINICMCFNRFLPFMGNLTFNKAIFFLKVCIFWVKLLHWISRYRIIRHLGCSQTNEPVSAEWICAEVASEVFICIHTLFNAAQRDTGALTCTYKCIMSLATEPNHLTPVDSFRNESHHVAQIRKTVLRLFKVFVKKRKEAKTGNILSKTYIS